MKKNGGLKVIQINGFRGLLLAGFIVSCLIAGFVAFPALMSMCLWNALAVKISSVPSISFIGGLLLWGIIVISFMIFNKKKFIVSFKAPNPNITDEELKQVISNFQSVDYANLTKDLKEFNEKIFEMNKTQEKKEQEDNNSTVNSNKE